MTEQEFNALKDKILQYDTICFDLFDTILNRKYSTYYSFNIVADYLIQEYFLCENIEKISSSLRYLLDDCTKNIDEKLKNTYYHYNIDKYDKFLDFKNKITKVFLNAEIRNTEIASFVPELLTLIPDNKNIYLISDFYFGKDFIKELLETNGIDYLKFKQIIISCEFGKSKADGGLYRCINSIDNSIMIGDNYQSDCIQSVKNGITASFCIKHHKNYIKYAQFNERYKNINDEIKKFIFKKKYFGAVNFIFPIFAFCKRLYSLLEKDSIVYFLSREGQFLKKCFDEYIFIHNEKNIKTKYLYASRWSLLLWNTSLFHNDYKRTMIDLNSCGIVEWKIKSGRTLLSWLGLTDNEIDKLFGDVNYIDDSNLDIERNEEFERVWELTETRLILDKKKQEVKDYIASQIKDCGDNLVVCEVGWQGTIQNILSSMFPAISFKGYYIGTTKCIGESSNNRKYGLLYDYGNDGTFYTGDVFRAFEMVLRADHGAVTTYREGNPVLKDDASVIIYNNYSSERQKIMFEIFKRLLAFDENMPIDYWRLNDLFRIICTKYPKSSSVVDNYNFWYQLKPFEKYNSPKYCAIKEVIIPIYKAVKNFFGRIIGFCINCLRKIKHKIFCKKKSTNL